MTASRIHADREVNLREIYSAIPDFFGLELFHFSDVSYFRSGRCVIRFYWERYEPTLISTEFLDPASPEDDRGMSLWVLKHVLGFQPQRKDPTMRFYSLGTAIVDCCDKLLQGDFSIRKQYDALERRILDEMSAVAFLPMDHPKRLQFEACDHPWLKKDIDRK